MIADAAPLARPGSNLRIAGRLRQAASLLTAQGANPFRAATYRRAADHPLMQITGRSRATRRARPARSAASTTAPTSL